MAKEKTVYVCSNCGQESPKWVGKCPSCGAWNTYVEEIVRKETVNKRPVSGMETAKAKPVTLDEIAADDEPRIDLHDAELNRVLGGRSGTRLAGADRRRTGYRKIHPGAADHPPHTGETYPLHIRRRKRPAAEAACRPSVRHIRRLPDCLRNLVGTDLRPHKEYTPRFSHNRLHTDHLHRDARILSRQHSPGERMLRLYPALRQRNAYGGHPHRPYQQGRKHCRA